MADPNRLNKRHPKRDDDDDDERTNKRKDQEKMWNALFVDLKHVVRQYLLDLGAPNNETLISACIHNVYSECLFRIYQGIVIDDSIIGELTEDAYERFFFDLDFKEPDPKKR